MPWLALGLAEARFSLLLILLLCARSSGSLPPRACRDGLDELRWMLGCYGSARSRWRPARGWPG
jgi:hypothetical protein